MWQNVWSVQCAMVKKETKLQEIKQRTKCFIQESFTFQPTGAMILIITTALLGLISYYDVMDLQEWVFCVSFISFATAYSIGSLMHRLSIKIMCLKILAILFLFASNLFLLLGLVLMTSIQFKSMLDFLIITSFGIVWIGAAILYSLRMAYNLLKI